MTKLVLLCVLAIGCNSPTSPAAPDAPKPSPDAPALTSSVVGTIAGNSYTIQDAVSVADIGQDGTALVIMSTMPGICTRITADTIDPSERLITITMTDDTSSSGSPPSAPGTYTVLTMGTTGHDGGLGADVFDAMCTHDDSASVNATSGSIQLASLAGNVFEGTFDVAFSVTGDHVTGSFAPTSCPGLVTVPRMPTHCM